MHLTWHNGVARVKFQEPNSNRFALMTGIALEHEPVKIGYAGFYCKSTSEIFKRFWNIFGINII